MVQNPDRKEFTGFIENTTLGSVSSQTDFYFDQDRNDEARDVENFDYGDFSAFRTDYDRPACAHHKESSMFSGQP